MGTVRRPHPVLRLGACAAEIDLLRKRGIGPYFLDFSANRTTMRLKIVKICPRFPTFSLRSFLRHRLLALVGAGRQACPTARLQAEFDHGLEYFRLNPLGAYCVGQADSYEPATPPVRTALTLYTDLRVQSTAPLPPEERVLLETYAKTESDGVWRLDPACVVGMWA